jgi:hypothetical protein
MFSIIEPDEPATNAKTLLLVLPALIVTLPPPSIVSVLSTQKAPPIPEAIVMLETEEANMMVVPLGAQAIAVRKVHFVT